MACSGLKQAKIRARHSRADVYKRQLQRLYDFGKKVFPQILMKCNRSLIPYDYFVQAGM